MFGCEIYNNFKKSFSYRTLPVDISKTNCMLTNVHSLSQGIYTYGHNLRNTVVVSFDIYMKWDCHYLLHICSMFYIKLSKSEKHSPDFKGQSCNLYNNKCMIASPQLTNSEIFAFIAVLIFKLLSRKVLFINRKDNKK